MPKTKYDPQTWFDDNPVIGKLPPHRAAARLQAAGLMEDAEAIERELDEILVGNPEALINLRELWPWQTNKDSDLSGYDRKTKKYQHTAHVFGYIPLQEYGRAEPIKIVHAGYISPDETLRNSRIKITLNALRVAKYPGDGEHHILFDFYAQNQIEGQTEHVHFNQTFRAREGERIAIIGYPIFIGLNIRDGVSFKVYTVNVRNENDRSMLSFLDSHVFQGGLELATIAQPAIAPLTDMAIGLTKMFLGRYENVAVQDFFMGLDFNQVPLGARLAEGAYIAIQVPESSEQIWNWDDWLYQPTEGRIVNKSNAKILIPYNYVVFGVSKYHP